MKFSRLMIMNERLRQRTSAMFWRPVMVAGPHLGGQVALADLSRRPAIMKE
jgi:hypothetical protein